MCTQYNPLMLLLRKPINHGSLTLLPFACARVPTPPSSNAIPAWSEQIQ